MRASFAAFCLAVVLFSLGARAAELPRIVLFGTEAGPAPSGFAEALSIQLAGFAALERGRDLEGTLPEKLDRVKAALSARSVVAVWVERVPSGDTEQEYVVHVASRRHDRVLIAVVRLPGPESAEIDRALALKVREVIAQVLAASVEHAAVAPPEPPRTEPPPRPRPPRPPAPESPRAGVVLDVSLLGASSGNGGGDEQLGARLGAGARLRGAGWTVEALVSGGAASGSRTEQRGREVETRELLALASARVLLSSRWAAAGAYASAGTRIVSASGRATDGRTGDATKLVPMVILGPEVRAALGDSVALRAAMGIELALRRQRFSVEGDVLGDVGSLRGVGEVGVVVAID